MRFSIDLKELQYILKCLRVSVRSTSTEAEGRVSIVANDNNTIDFSTTVGIIGTTIKANIVKIDTIGAIDIVYSDLQNFVGSFKPFEDDRGVKEVNFKLNEKSLSVGLDNFYGDGKISKSNIKLKLYGAVGATAKTFDQISFVLSSSMLKASIDKIIGAIDPLNHNTYLRGLNINFTKDIIYFAGTNGVIVSEYAIKNTSNLADKSYLLTHDFVKGLRGILANISKEESQVEFDVSDKLIKVNVSGVIFWGQLLVGHTFPDYRTVFTKPYKHRLVIDRELLLNNLGPITSLLVDDDNNRMSISIESSTVRLYNDLAESLFELESPFEGTFIIDVNGRLCKDLVTTIRDDRIILCFNDEKDNIMFDSEMFEDQKSLLTFIRRRNL
jgi:DNA polymerase III sliding clamp (beta) subunit (PCNA family)